MDYIYKYLDEKTTIIINSPKPEDLTTSEDIRAILLYEFPKLRSEYFIVSNVHDNFAVLVGDNINCQGKVIIQLKKSINNLKGEKHNAPTCWDYTIK